MSASASARLGDFVEILSGFAFDAANFSDDGDIALIRIRDVLRGRSNTFYRGEYDEKYLINEGEILIGMDGEFNRARWQSAPALLNQRVCKIHSNSPRLADEYLFHFLPAALKSIEDATSFVTVKHLSAKQIREIEIPLPSVEEQRRIAAILDQAETLRTQRRAALAHLDSLTQSIFLDMFGDPVSNPKGWPLKPISSLGKVVTGNTPSRDVPDYYGDAVEWIKSDNVNTPHYYLTKATEGLSETGRAVGRVVPSNSILVTCIAGSPECIGNAAMADREVAFNQQINAFIPSELDAHFAYGQIVVGKKLIQSASTNGMKGMVSKSRFEAIEFMVPPPSLQQTFATRIQAIEALKATHRTALAQLDALFASLQHRAFAGAL